MGRVDGVDAVVVGALRMMMLLLMLIMLSGQCQCCAAR